MLSKPGVGFSVGILADMAIDSVKDSNLVRINAEHLFPPIPLGLG